jgi:hypothetical protein
MRNDPEQAASGIHRSAGIEPFPANDPVSDAIGASAGIDHGVIPSDPMPPRHPSMPPVNPDAQGTLNAG